MAGLLMSPHYFEHYGAGLIAAAGRAGVAFEPVLLPADPEARLDPVEAAKVEVAFFCSDMVPTRTRQFFSAAFKTPNLKWVHVFNAGIDHPVFGDLMKRGVRLSNSSGANAEPVAVTAVAGILMLARNFPVWLDGQRAHDWRQMRLEAQPDDLRGQRMVIVGLGEIGRHIARVMQALGVEVLAVRRTPKQAGDPVDAVHPPAKLAELASGAHWLVLACPLTDETRGLVDAAMLARLPRGARFVNVARGEVVDEAALVEALRSGQLGGAYLDVFTTEPLPADSPLWDLPNVILSPHNASASTGNDARVNEIFLENAARWAKNQPLRNEVTTS